MDGETGEFYLISGIEMAVVLQLAPAAILVSVLPGSAGAR